MSSKASNKVGTWAGNVWASGTESLSKAEKFSYNCEEIVTLKKKKKNLVCTSEAA